MNKSFLRLVLAGTVLAALVLCGYWLLFTQFMVYDDEGYVLWSLRNYFVHGGLYTQVYSQYGPFLYAFYDALHAIFGLPFDNVTGRLLTLGYWCGAAGLGGWFVWRQTRSTIVAVAAGVLTFGSLHIMINEPVHPGGLLAFLSAVGAVIGAEAVAARRPVVFAALVGGVGAMMMLTKINVGAFFLIAAGSWLAINLVSPRPGRISLWLAALGSLLLPLWLMQKLWPAPWVAIFCLTFSCAALALLMLMQEKRAPEFGWRAWRWFIGVVLFASAIILGAVWLRGTSLAMLWQGVVVAPLRQPLVYANAVAWPRSEPWLVAGLFLLAVLSHPRSWPWRAPLIATLRLIALGCFLSFVPKAINDYLVVFCFWYGPALAWLMTVPLNHETPTISQRMRVWVAWVFIWQTLHAYPVAGSQMGWGAFLWVPLAVVGGHEALHYWAQRLPGYQHAIRTMGAVILSVVCLMLLGSFVYASSARYYADERLGLPGTGDLRLSEDMATIYRILDKNIRLHGDELFSYPGMFSLNIWTDRPTPTTANVTHWFSLLTDAQQQAIIDQLEHDPRPVIVAQSYLINYLVYHGFPPRGSLQRYIVQHFEPAFHIDTFQFWVRRGRTIAPISTVLFTATETAGLTKLELTTDAIGQASAIEIRGLFPPHNVIARLQPTTSRPWIISRVSADNTPLTTTSQAGPAASLEGLTRIEAKLWLGTRKLPPLDLLEVVLLDPAGHELDKLRFTN